MGTKNKFESGPFVRQLVESGNELEDRYVKELLDRNTDEDWSLIINYLKIDLSKRLEQVLLCINFDLVTSENYDRYVLNKKTLKELLSEKDGIIDTGKREQAKLLLKSIPRQKGR